MNSISFRASEDEGLPCFSEIDNFALALARSRTRCDSKLFLPFDLEIVPYV